MIDSRLKRLKFIVLACLLLFAGLTPRLQAQNQENSSEVEGITVSPPLKELVLGPGLVEAHTNVTVTNTTGQDVVATIRLVDFEALDEFGGVSLGQAGATSGKYGLAGWMSLPGGPTYKIQNGKSATVPIAIANKDDLTPGGHYGAAIVSISSDPISGSGNGVALKREVASLLFVKKLGGEVYGLRLESLKTDKPGTVPSTVTTKFKGTGNVHVVPRGYVEVTDPKGKLVSKGILNPESTIVMPDSSRQYVTIMQPVQNSSAWGQYTITAHYRHDDQEKFETYSVHFNRGLSKAATIGFGVASVIMLIILLVLARKPLQKRKNYKKHLKRKP
jgi:hypothetical protein